MAREPKTVNDALTGRVNHRRRRPNRGVGGSGLLLIFCGKLITMTGQSNTEARSLAGFVGTGYDKGRPRVVQALWFAVQNLLFYQWWLPAAVRPKLLSLFGARIGRNVLIRHRVR